MPRARRLPSAGKKSGSGRERFWGGGSMVVNLRSGAGSSRSNPIFSANLSSPISCAMRAGNSSRRMRFG